MAWNPTENFDSYSVGVTLGGGSGGSGWSAAWTITGGGDVTTETAPAGMSGVAARHTSTAARAERPFTAITEGSVRIKIRISGTAPNNDDGVVLQDSADAGKMFVFFKDDGNIKIFNNDTASYETIQAYAADTTYTLDIQFDDAAQPDLYRARIDGGAWTAWKKVNGGSYADIGKLVLFGDANNVTIHWDAIEPMPADGGGLANDLMDDGLIYEFAGAGMW